jgi:hypothetical protein
VKILKWIDLYSSFTCFLFAEVFAIKGQNLTVIPGFVPLREEKFQLQTFSQNIGWFMQLHKAEKCLKLRRKQLKSGASPSVVSIDKYQYINLSGGNMDNTLDCKWKLSSTRRKQRYHGPLQGHNPSSTQTQSWFV